MTLTVQHVAEQFQCGKCSRKLGQVHNGALYVTAGKTTVITQSGSIVCPYCNYWNHVAVKDEAVVE